MEDVAAELTIVQELVYELKIEQVMAKDVISVTPECSIADLKELLRTKRISGVPVVDSGALVGMISIENLIRALEDGELEASVGEKMTRDVVVVRSDETVVSAVNLFARLGYGRFPVVDAEGHLVGVLTKGDIVRGLLRRMQVRWQTEEIRRYRASHIFEDIESDQTALILRYAVQAHDFVRGGEASSKLKRALEHLGAHPRIVRRVAVAAYEAETNVMIHSHGGEIIAEIRPERMRITAVDTGPGIPDIEQAMQAGYSTAPDWIRELGFGAGMGLSNIKACADEMRLTSQVGRPGQPGAGTRLEMIFYLRDRDEAVS
ncbi:MAG: CBS domain-containing protein [Anaerolineae bacterium]|nr:CBS domain-containing protein [Anaerolineae bacterium]